MEQRQEPLALLISIDTSTVVSAIQNPFDDNHHTTLYTSLLASRALCMETPTVHLFQPVSVFPTIP